MGVNWGNLLYYLIPLALCLAGFHGVFFYPNLWKKTASWCVFQLGLMLFLLLLASGARTFSHAMAFLILAFTVGTGILLSVFCLKLQRRHKTPDGGEIAKKVSK